MAEQLAKSLDLGICFDYTRAVVPGRPISPRALERFGRVQERIKNVLSPDPTTVFFYFSSYLEERDGRLVKAKNVSNNQAYQDDLERINFYKEQLHDRFFLFTGGKILRRSEIELRLYSCGLVYSPLVTQLNAYGEFLGLYVEQKKKMIQEQLQLPDERVQSLPDLSLTRMRTEDLCLGATN